MEIVKVETPIFYDGWNFEDADLKISGDIKKWMDMEDSVIDECWLVYKHLQRPIGYDGHSNVKNLTLPTFKVWAKSKGTTNVTLFKHFKRRGYMQKALPKEPIEETETEQEIEYQQIFTIGNQVLIHSDNKDVNLNDYEFGLCFCDPPYNATDKDWDGGFVWEHDYLLDHCEIIAVTPGISSIKDFHKLTFMNYKWSLSCHISNGMTRGALGFGNWIYTAVFSSLKSIHKNAQDVKVISISGKQSEGGGQRMKPASYMLWILELLAGDKLILDPFAGTGSTAIAAMQLGLPCVSIEKDKETFMLMVKRVKNGLHALQQNK